MLGQVRRGLAGDSADPGKVGFSTSAKLPSSIDIAQALLEAQARLLGRLGFRGTHQQSGPVAKIGPPAPWWLGGQGGTLPASGKTTAEANRQHCRSRAKRLRSQGARFA